MQLLLGMMLSLDLCSWRGGHLRRMNSVKGVRMDRPHDFPRGLSVWEEWLESGKKVRSHVCGVRAYVHVYKLLPRDPVLSFGVPKLRHTRPGLLHILIIIRPNLPRLLLPPPRRINWSSSLEVVHYRPPIVDGVASHMPDVLPRRSRPHH
jgi:hypothetical protein